VLVEGLGGRSFAFGERRSRSARRGPRARLAAHERRVHPHPRQGVARGERQLRKRIVGGDRASAALDLQVDVERAGHVAAEELGQRIVAQADELGQQADRQQFCCTAAFDDDLGQRGLGQVLAALGVHDPHVVPALDLQGELF